MDSIKEAKKYVEWAAKPNVGQSQRSRHIEIAKLFLEVADRELREFELTCLQSKQESDT